MCASCVRRGREGRRGPYGPSRLRATLGARNIKRGLSCSREWRILCRFLVDRAPDSIAAAIGCAPSTELIKIVGVPRTSFSLPSSPPPPLLLDHSLILALSLFLSEILPPSRAAAPLCPSRFSFRAFALSSATFLSLTATSPSRLSLYLAALLPSSFFSSNHLPVPQRRGCDPRTSPT